MYHPYSRRDFLIDSGKTVLGATTLGMFLEGCGQSTAHVNRSTGTVTYWEQLNYTGTAAIQRAKVKQLDQDDFNRTHPGIKYRIIFKDDVNGALRAALAANQGPDIIYGDSATLGLTYVQGGHTQPLDKYASQFGWNKKILKWAYDSGYYHGTLNFVPIYSESYVIFYNKTLFQAKGWTVPTSTSEFLDLVKEINGQGIIPFWGAAADYDFSYIFATVFLNHAAGPKALYQALTNQISFTDSIFVDAFTMLQQFFQKGWIAGGFQKFIVANSTNAYADFAKGKIAMDMDGSYNFGNLQPYFGAIGGNTADFDWFPIPPLHSWVPNELYALGIGGTVSINARSQVADAAATYLDWFFSTTKRMTIELGQPIGIEPPPVRLSEGDFSGLTNLDHRWLSFYARFNKATEKGNFGYTTSSYFPPKTNALFQGTAIQKLLAGQLSAADYCALLDKTFKAEIVQGGIPVPKGNF